MISPTFLLYTSRKNSFGLLFIKIAVGPYPTVQLENIYEFTPLKEVHLFLGIKCKSAKPVGKTELEIT